MRTLVFCKRNIKEILRDPLSLIFLVGFPVVLLIFFQILVHSLGEQMLQATPQFKINNLASSISIFGFSFLTLFCGLLISKDRVTSFATRLRTTPMTNWDFIFGYLLPMLPIALAQNLICFLVALIFGLKISFNLLLAMVVLIPSAVLFVGLGVLIGSVFSDKVVGGVASIIVNLAAILGGMFFPLRTMKGAFATIAYIFPFAHAVDSACFAVSGQYADIIKPLIVVSIYAVVVLVVSLIVFKRKMLSDKT